MALDLGKMLQISAAGLTVQTARMRVIAENIANASSLAQTPGGEPYQRKTITFKNTLDRALGLNLVEVSHIGVDKSEFGQKYDPGHPGANETGYVLTPNVQSIVEMTDMREAQRSYEANLSVITVAKDMLRRTVELLQ